MHKIGQQSVVLIIVIEKKKLTLLVTLWEIYLVSGLAPWQCYLLLGFNLGVVWEILPQKIVTKYKLTIPDNYAGNTRVTRSLFLGQYSSHFVPCMCHAILSNTFCIIWLPLPSSHSLCEFFPLSSSCQKAYNQVPRCRRSKTKKPWTIHVIVGMTLYESKVEPTWRPLVPFDQPRQGRRSPIFQSRIVSRSLLLIHGFTLLLQFNWNFHFIDHSTIVQYVVKVINRKTSWIIYKERGN